MYRYTMREQSGPRPLVRVNGAECVQALVHYAQTVRSSASSSEREPLGTPGTGYLAPFQLSTSLVTSSKISPICFRKILCAYGGVSAGRSARVCRNRTPPPGRRVVDK